MKFIINIFEQKITRVVGFSPSKYPGTGGSAFYPFGAFQYFAFTQVGLDSVTVGSLDSWSSGFFLVTLALGPIHYITVKASTMASGDGAKCKTCFAGPKNDYTCSGQK